MLEGQLLVVPLDGLDLRIVGRPGEARWDHRPRGNRQALVGRFLGVWQEDVRYETDGDVRRFTIPKIIDGEIAPIAGSKPGQPTTIENSQYWIGPQIIVAQALKSRFRGHGRNWDFKGRSAEICALDWKGP